MNARSRLAILTAAREGTLNYIPSAELWTIDGRLVDYATIDLDPAEPERCRTDGLLITVFDAWDHYRGILTRRGRERLSRAEAAQLKSEPVEVAPPRIVLWRTPKDER